jgi:hypothetical protein
VQSTDDSKGARTGVDSSGEGHLLRELQDGLLLGPAAVWSLRFGEDRSIGSLNPRAVGPRSGSGARIGRIAVRLLRASI